VTTRFLLISLHEIRIVIEMKTQSPSISRRQVLDAISDNESLELFHAIATNVNDVELKMTHKQYYVQLNRLMEAGIIKKRNNTYCLTSFGKVVLKFN
jgi:predicted transcriptional regulator